MGLQNPWNSKGSRSLGLKASCSQATRRFRRKPFPRKHFPERPALYCYALDSAVEAKLVELVEGLGPNCRISKFQWLIATSEPCGAITQDLGHEGVENVFVFSALVGTDWKLWCKPQGKTDEREFDGIAAFLQQQLG